MKPYGLKEKKVKLCRCCVGPNRGSKEVNGTRARREAQAEVQAELEDLFQNWTSTSVFYRQNPDPEEKYEEASEEE